MNLFTRKPFAKKAHISFLLTMVVALGIVLSACGGSQPTTAPAPGNTGATNNPTAAGNTPQTINIDIINFKYSPVEVTIAAGTTVVWTNKDGAKHNVIADDKSFESPTMEKGATYSRKFDTPGTIGYFCSFHGSAGQGMIGKLIVTPANVAAAQPTAVANVNPTPTQAVVAANPTVTQAAGQVSGGITATVAAVVPSNGQQIGAINFRDDLQNTDQLVINIDNLPAAPTGRVFFGWLVNSTNNKAISMGQLLPGSNGALSRKYNEPQNANLLANYDKFIITGEILDPTPSLPSNSVLYSGQLPGPSLIHIRHLLVSFPATPNKIGLEVGLLGQVQEMRRHAEFMRDALNGNNLEAVKLHAEHVVNLIEGSKGANYGDLNKDGQAQNPGDGYGLLKNGDQLGYLEGSKEHANLAAKAEGATDDIKLHAGHVAITVDNVSGWVTTIRDRSLAVLKLTDVKAAQPLVREILTLANQSLNGVDIKGDGQILPIPGSGAAITSYQHAQLMAAIPLKANGSTNAPANANATAKPTDHSGHNHTATSPAQNNAGGATGAVLGGAGQEVKIDISQFKFGNGNPITIKAGTKVTWTNQDAAPHTATADNSAWDSGTLQKGQSFSIVFAKAGTVKYHCEVHPNMTATINVVD
jgi:plastocyanin